MSTREITDTAIRELSGDREAYLWDEKLKGFGVRMTVSADGKVRKNFIVKYALGGRRGRQRKMKLGAFGPLNTQQARKLAQEVLRKVSFGEDPAGVREAKRNEGTVSATLDDFVEMHVRTKLRPRSQDEYVRILDRIVRPAIGSIAIRDVTGADVARLHHKLSKTPVQANRTMAILSKFFRWCEKQDRRDLNSNPVRAVDKNPEQHRERFLSATELERLGAALAASDEWPTAVAAIRLLMFTGARRNEILELKWEDVDMERGIARIDGKTGRRNIFLPAPAREVLAALPRRKKNPHVIWGRLEGSRLVGLQKPWERIRDAAGLPDVRIHDLRHTAASVAVQGGASLKLVGALLGHKSPLTTNRYAHLAEDPAAALAEKVAGQIAAISTKKVAR